MTLFSSPRVHPMAPLVLSLLVGLPAAVGVAQDPLPGTPSDPPALRIPPQSMIEEGDKEEVPEVVEGGAVDKIREMLQGEGDRKETGDPILDGVLDLLRSRGSVLDGSTLDPHGPHDPNGRQSPDLHDPHTPPRQPREFEPPFDGRRWVPSIDGEGRPRLESDSGRGESANESANAANRYLLAEQLLKTARLLAAQPHLDAGRRRLIDELRREAARSLMLEPVPPVEPLRPPDRPPVPAGHAESF